MLELTINNKDTVEMSLKVGEEINLTLTYTEDGDVLDVSSATFTVKVKTAKGVTASITVADGDMDKTNAATGIILAPIDTSTLSAGDYILDVKTVFSATSVEFSPDINLTMIDPVTD